MYLQREQMVHGKVRMKRRYWKSRWGFDPKYQPLTAMPYNNRIINNNIITMMGIAQSTEKILRWGRDSEKMSPMRLPVGPADSEPTPAVPELQTATLGPSHWHPQIGKTAREGKDADRRAGEAIVDVGGVFTARHLSEPSHDDLFLSVRYHEQVFRKNPPREGVRTAARDRETDSGRIVNAGFQGATADLQPTTPRPILGCALDADEERIWTDWARSAGAVLRLPSRRWCALLARRALSGQLDNGAREAGQEKVGVRLRKTRTQRRPFVHRRCHFGRPAHHAVAGHQ